MPKLASLDTNQLWRQAYTSATDTLNTQGPIIAGARDKTSERGKAMP